MREVVERLDTDTRSAVQRLCAKLRVRTAMDWKAVEGDGRQLVVSPFSMTGERLTDLDDLMCNIAILTARNHYGFQARREYKPTRICLELPENED